ncbi:MAG TPA: hypothetical protein VLB11_01150, partial [Methyloceanibacter sp.]|nr:hypothetical protein [Methyloceanibacter sp.]
MTEPFDRLWRILAVGALIGLLLLPGSLLADDTAQAPKTDTAGAPSPDVDASEGEASADRTASFSLTHHSIKLGGVDVPYSAKTGTLPLRDAQGKETASIFFVAYLREPHDPSRPITFVFNGGPGAASAYLHLGAIGPKTVEVNAKGELLGPPSRLTINDASWIDFTDLVFVDPVGTGYSRVAEGKSESDFWGVEQDTDALADFIRLYLIGAARMSSPVFLAGESYGGFRAATITRALQKTGGISPSGLVLIS